LTTLSDPTTATMNSILLLLATLLSCSSAFAPAAVSTRTSFTLSMVEETKAAPLVSGEELEIMLTEWDQPLVVDAYATYVKSIPL
jgi:hypothetical protein